MVDTKYPPSWIVVDHFIPGCTEEMIDWWWVNMEKGYELWCPDEHKGFKWMTLPPPGGHIGAVQIAKESIDFGPVMDLRIEWVDPNFGDQAQKDFWTYSHLLTAGSSGAQPGTKPFVMLSHQWEAVPGGCKMRSCMHRLPGPPPGGPPGGGPPRSRCVRPVRQWISYPRTQWEKTIGWRLARPQYRRSQYLQEFPAGALGHLAGSNRSCH